MTVLLSIKPALTRVLFSFAFLPLVSPFQYSPLCVSCICFWKICSYVSCLFPSPFYIKGHAFYGHFCALAGKFHTIFCKSVHITSQSSSFFSQLHVLRSVCTPRSFWPIFCIWPFRLLPGFSVISKSMAGFVYIYFFIVGNVC